MKNQFPDLKCFQVVVVTLFLQGGIQRGPVFIKLIYMLLINYLWDNLVLAYIHYDNSDF